MPQSPQFKTSYGDIAYQLALEVVPANPQLAPLHAIILGGERLAVMSILAELEMFGGNRYDEAWSTLCAIISKL